MCFNLRNLLPQLSDRSRIHIGFEVYFGIDHEEANSTENDEGNEQALAIGFAAAEERSFGFWRGHILKK